MTDTLIPEARYDTVVEPARTYYAAVRVEIEPNPVLSWQRADIRARNACRIAKAEIEVCENVAAEAARRHPGVRLPNPVLGDLCPVPGGIAVRATMHVPAHVRPLEATWRAQ